MSLPKMNDIRIIPFESSHQQQVTELFLHGLSNYETVSPSGRASQITFARMKTAEGGDMHDIYESYMTNQDEVSCRHFWVAVDENNRVLGSVGIIMSTYDEKDEAIYQAESGGDKLSPSDVCELVRMTVSKEARGKGLGSRLYRVFEEYARARNMKRVVLSTLEEMHLAVGLYEKCGFRLLMKTLVEPEFFTDIVKEKCFEIEDVVVVHYGKDL